MTLDTFLAMLHDAPLVASVQASSGSPLQDDETLLRMAQASLQEGVRVLRLESAATVRRIKSETGVVCIGLIKRYYPHCEVYVTPTSKEIDELLATECEVVSLDATERARPNNEDLRVLVKRCHEAGRLVMADCDTFATGQNAVSAGADILGPTLAGYTPDSTMTKGPDLACLSALVELGVPVLAEGRYQEEWHIEAALRIGAVGVVIGGALNDPVKQTRRFLGTCLKHERSVAAFDLGGTWMRFGLFNPSWELLETDWVQMPPHHSKRLEWMNEKVRYSRVDRAGVSSGGVVAPTDSQVVHAKETIKGIIGASLRLDVETFALNDGLATAWGHACFKGFAGMSVASLALGTGVGSGFVHQFQFVPAQKGWPCEINDLYGPGGKTIEELCGGGSLSKEPTEEETKRAIAGAKEALRIVRSVYRPDRIVVSGGVGLSDWMVAGLEGEEGVVRTPFGHDAGLFGAAALALFPPRGVFEGRG